MITVDLHKTSVRELNRTLHALPADTNERLWRVLNPRGAHALATLRLRHAADAVVDVTEPAAATLPLLAALARGGASNLRLANGATSALSLEVSA